MALQDLDFEELKLNAAEPIRDRKYIVAILDLLKDNPRDECLFLVGISSHLRGGDLVRLTIKHAINIIDRGYCVIQEGKTRKKREVYLNSDAKNSLSKLLRHRQLQGAKPTDRLFVGQRGALTRATFSRLVKKWCKAVGVPGKISGHTLRKSYGFFQFQFNGISLPALMADFNHSCEQMTLLYIGVTDRCETQQRNEDFKL